MAGDRVPLEGLTPGTHLPCTVVAEVQGAGSKKVHALELSARPAAVAAAREGRPAGFRYTLPGLRQGQVRGWEWWLWYTLPGPRQGQ